MTLVISQKDLKQLKEVFALVDKDQDGSISAQQLKEALQYLHYNTPEDRLERLFRSFDTDGNGSIELGEFVVLMLRIKQSKSGEKIQLDYQEAFRLFDNDGSGTINTDKLVKVLNGMGNNISRRSAENMINQADTNGDGEIDFFEFRGIIEQLQARKLQQQESKQVCCGCQLL